MVTAHARLEFPATGRERRLAAVRVRVEDVSRADAAARVVGQSELSDVVVPPEGLSLEVDVEYPAPKAGTTLTVRAHGSVDGEDAFAKGDFLSTVSTPAAPRVAIPLRAI
jgi:uncharacterized lipoprotein YbaY